MSIKADDMLMDVAWSYPRIERIVVTFHLSLIFSKPSELLNTTAVIHNKKYFHIILEGNESCDPFTLCITGVGPVCWQAADSPQFLGTAYIALPPEFSKRLETSL